MQEFLISLFFIFTKILENHSAPQLGVFLENVYVPLFCLSVKYRIHIIVNMINLCLCREFLEFFNLDFTLAVFDPETNIGKDFRYRGRSKLIDALGLTELVDPKLPLLNEIMRLSKVSVLKSESPTPTEISVEDENTSNQTSLAEDPSRGDPPHKLRNRKQTVKTIIHSHSPVLRIRIRTQGAKYQPFIKTLKKPLIFKTKSDLSTKERLTTFSLSLNGSSSFSKKKYKFTQ